MTEIRLPYSEYKKMLETIEEQDKALKKIENEKGTIVIDKRYNVCRNNIGNVIYDIPKINGDEAKDFLRNEFDNLHKNVLELNREFELYKNHQRLERLAKPRKKWFNF